MNPYKVLGIREEATQEEIRAAYLGLVKKYHPDKYIDNPLKELANEKLKEINEAYEVLTKRGTSANAAHHAGANRGQYGAYSGSGTTYSGPNAAEFAQVRILLSNHNLQEARRLLENIAVRNAEWHYLYGLVFYRMGYMDKAKEHFTRAYEQEPGNASYRSAYTTINSTGSPFGRYQQTRTTNAYDDQCSCCDICTLCCAAWRC